MHWKIGMKSATRIMLLLLTIGALSACKGPGEAYYDKGGDLKNLADKMEGDERVKAYQNAIEQLKLAVEKEPENGKFISKLAKCYKNIGDWENAIDCFKRATEVDPDDSENYYNLMKVYVRNGQFEEAQKVYNFAATLDVIKRAPRERLHLDEALTELNMARRAAEQQAAHFTDEVVPAQDSLTADQDEPTTAPDETSAVTDETVAVSSDTAVTTGE
ncbi:tetratricopeptide repeat protein [Candidatus Sumerlaeota bacterium]|nr:tetratricopeptide repeat protein [Candidatus Sumerlaeota bacterium]